MEQGDECRSFRSLKCFIGENNPRPKHHTTRYICNCLERQATAGIPVTLSTIQSPFFNRYPNKLIQMKHIFPMWNLNYSRNGAVM